MTSLLLTLVLSTRLAHAECAHVDVAATLKAAESAVDAEGGGAVGVVSTAWHALPNSCEPVATSTLFALATKAGTLLAASGTANAGDAWFDRAAMLAPNEPPPADLAKEATTALADAATRRATKPTVRVVASQAVVLDGVAMDARATATPTAGEHLVQWQYAGAWTGAWLNLQGVEVLDIPAGKAITVMPMVEAAKPKPAGPVALIAGGLFLAAVGGGVYVAANADHGSGERTASSTGLGFVIGGGAAAVAGGIWGVTLILPHGNTPAGVASDEPAGIAVSGSF